MAAFCRYCHTVGLGARRAGFWGKGRSPPQGRARPSGERAEAGPRPLPCGRTGGLRPQSPVIGYHAQGARPLGPHARPAEVQVGHPGARRAPRAAPAPVLTTGPPREALAPGPELRTHRRERVPLAKLTPPRRQPASLSHGRPPDPYPVSPLTWDPYILFCVPKC